MREEVTVEDVRVLVVDDSALIRAVVRSHLEEHGYVVAEATDGRHALAAAAAGPPDVIVLDIEMPGMDGHEVLAALRGEEDLAHIPVIVLSGRSDVDHVVVGLESGAHDYLGKPFEAGELLARVRAAARVKRLNDEVRERNLDLERTAAQLAERNAALTEANTALTAANQLKLDLMGMLSHEIGRPLTLILGYAELLQEMVGGTGGDVGGCTTMIMRGARELGRMREEILAMCALDTGSLVAERSPVRVADAVADALAATEQDVPVLGDTGAVALVNPRHLEHVVANFLTNAAKYAGGATRVEVEATGRAVDVRVVDAGPGVPESLRPRLFDRFVRGEDETSRRLGTGLGLYIVRGLAEANRGTVRHEPAEPRGSVFAVRLEQVPAQAYGAGGSSAGT